MCIRDRLYTVKHVVDGVEQTADTKTYTGKAWINEKNPTIKIEAGSLAQKTYTGYTFKSIDTTAQEGDSIASGTTITLTYVRDDGQTKTVGYTVEYYKDGVHVTGDDVETEKSIWVNESLPVSVDVYKRQSRETARRNSSRSLPAPAARWRPAATSSAASL